MTVHAAPLRRLLAAVTLTVGATLASGALVAPAASAAVPLGSYRCVGGLSDGRWLEHTQDDFDACRASGGEPVWVADPPVGPPPPLEMAAP